MEQHPIPQNVTNFQFKLIGDITLKQFGYLAGGLLIGYLCTKVPLVPEFLRWPIGGLFVILGFGLAFVPIEQRPMDRLLLAFFKSIYLPTQYVWQKQNLPPEALISLPAVQIAVQPIIKPTVIVPPVKLVAHQPLPSNHFVPKPPPRFVPVPVQAKPVPPHFPLPKPQTKPKPGIIQPPPQYKPTAKAPIDRWTLGAPPVVIKTAAPIPTKPYNAPVTGNKIIFNQTPIKPIVPINTSQQADAIKSQYAQVTQKLSQQITLLQKEMQQGTLAKDRLMELQQTLLQLLQEKERLDNEVVELRKKLAAKNSTRTETPSMYANKPQEAMPTVKIIAPQAAVRSGIPQLTNQPNVITGIIKDSRGTLLPNLIVTVKDKEGVPVRALKTNKLGQFAASTPLRDNAYFIEVEDPKKQYTFNRVEVELSSKILPPLEISAVSEKDILRQKLSQELFGGNKI